MKRVLALSAVCLFSQYGTAQAMTFTEYAVLRETLFFVFSLGCVGLAAALYANLKGGSLGVPWIVFTAGFALAAIGAAVQLFDILEIVLHQYDLRLVLLITRAGAALLFLAGLVLYKKGMQ